STIAYPIAGPGLVAGDRTARAGRLSTRPARGTLATMSSIHALALRWLGEERRVVAATLVETVGSAPLDPGAVMLVDEAGRIEGSVTGGCVEGALVEEAQGILAGAPPRVATYGISDSQAADV